MATGSVNAKNLMGAYTGESQFVASRYSAYISTSSMRDLDDFMADKMFYNYKARCDFGPELAQGDEGAAPDTCIEDYCPCEGLEDFKDDDDGPILTGYDEYYCQMVRHDASVLEVVLEYSAETTAKLGEYWRSVTVDALR